MQRRGTNGQLNTAVARVLSDTRERAGMSTRQLATAADIDHRTMMRYLYDERAIDIDRLDRLSRALDLTPTEVLTRAQALIAAEGTASS